MMYNHWNGILVKTLFFADIFFLRHIYREHTFLDCLFLKPLNVSIHGLSHTDLCKFVERDEVTDISKPIIVERICLLLFYACQGLC